MAVLTHTVTAELHKLFVAKIDPQSVLMPAAIMWMKCSHTSLFTSLTSKACGLLCSWKTHVWKKILNVKERGFFKWSQHGVKEGNNPCDKTLIISLGHLSTHLSSGSTVRPFSPTPNLNISLMENLGRKRSLKTFLGIEATRVCCCRITQADPFENNFKKETGSL